jgi:hypothetical protein
MSKVTELASGQITAVHTLTIELVEANETRLRQISGVQFNAPVSLKRDRPVTLCRRSAAQSLCLVGETGRAGADLDAVLDDPPMHSTQEGSRS